MSPFQLFKVCQGAIGRRYRGTIDDFDDLDCASYYYSLSDFLKKECGRNSNSHRKYISVCEMHYGTRFDPFHLMTEDYISVYKEWQSINGDSESYKKNILKSIQHVYNFCRDRDIHTLKQYVQRWSVSHITSGVLNENVAYVLKVHDARLTKPEKRLIKKRYTDKIKDVKERLDRETDLKDFIVMNLETVENKIKD
jgi:hypothetical protein